MWWWWWFKCKEEWALIRFQGSVGNYAGDAGEWVV